MKSFVVGSVSASVNLIGETMGGLRRSAALPIFLLTTLIANPANGTETLTLSFREKQFDRMTCAVVGDSSAVHPEPEGLRITVAPPNDGNCGIRIPQQLIGDFVITATVSLLDVPTPKAGHGTGITILVEDAESCGASLQRIVTDRGAQSIICHDFTVNAGQYDHHAKPVKAPDGKVTLQLERKSDQLHYRVSTDAGATFSELHSVPFSSNPIRVMQVYGQPGGHPNPLSVQLHELTVVADQWVRPGQGTPNAPSRIGLALIAVLVVAAAVTVLVILARRPVGPETHE